MTDEKFAEFLKGALDDLDPVPMVPREEMWARIQAQRSFQTQVPARRSHNWLAWGVGLAAMLALGVGLGRYTITHSGKPASQPVASAPAVANQAAYHVVLAQYMSSAEALLTSYRTQPQGTVDPQIAQWAADMLTNTRMLLDSPAGRDTKTEALLQDLELILAQIAQLSAPSQLEQDLIQDGINKTAVLPRIRAAQPMTAGT